MRPTPALTTPTLAASQEESEGEVGHPAGEEAVEAAFGRMDNAGKEREAVQLMADAEKRLKASHSFLRGLFG